jgi:hypothetical protein
LPSICLMAMAEGIAAARMCIAGCTVVDKSYRQVWTMARCVN